MMPPRTPADTRKVRGGRFSKILLVAAGGFCVLLAALLVALHSSPGRKAVLRRVTQLLAAQRVEFQTDELRYNLFGLSLGLRNVVLRSPDAPDLPPFATIQDLDVTLSLPDLVRRKFVIRTGQISDADVKYVIDERGLDNVPRPPRDPERAGQPLDYLISDLSITRARVQYENRAQGIEATLPLSSVKVTGNRLTDRHAIEAEAGAGRVRVKDRTLAFDRLTTEVDAGREDLRVEALQIDAEGSRATVTGTVSNVDAPELALSIQSQLDLARLSRVAQLPDPAGGTAAVDVTVTGPAGAPAIEGRIDGQAISYRTLDQLTLSAAGKYDVAGRVATLERLDVRAPWGGASGSGTIALDSANTSQVRATVSGLDARTLMQALDQPYAVASRIDGQIAAQWPGLDYASARSDARVSLTPNAAPSRGVIPVGGGIDVRGRDGGIDARIRTISAAGATASGDVRITSQRRLSGQLTTNVADVAGTASRLETLLGRARGSLLPIRVQGAATVRSTLTGTVESPAVAATIDAPALAAGDLSGVAVKGQIGYTQAALTIEKADVTWRPQGAAQAPPAHATLAGRIELTGARRLDVTLRASQLEAASLLAAAGQSLPVSGTFTVDATARGTTSQPIVDLRAHGEHLVAYSEPWGTLDATGTLDGRVFQLTDLRVDKPQQEGRGSLVASGRYDLDRRAYTFEIGSNNLALVGLTLVDGQVLQGDLALAARGAGTLDDPQADVDLTSNALLLNQRELGPLTIDADVRGRQATVRVAAERFAAKAEARIETARAFQTTLHAELADLDLARVAQVAAPAMETPLTGRVQATVDATGPLTDLQAASATASVAAFAGEWNGRPFRLEEPAVLRYADQRVETNRVHLTAQDSSVIASGGFPVTGSGRDGALTIEGPNLATLAQYTPRGTDIAADGRLTLSGTVRGNLRALDPDLIVKVEDGLVLLPSIEPGLSNIDGTARIASGEAVIERLTASWGSAALDANGRVPLDVLPALPIEIPRQGGPATFTAHLVGFNPSAIPGAPAELNGRISVTADMSATRADLHALTGQITFPDLTLDLDGLTLEQKAPSSIRLADAAATIEQLDLAGTLGVLGVTGHVNLAGDRAIDVAAKGDLNVAAVSLVTDRVSAEGDASIDITARGTLNAPELSGHVTLEDANVVAEDLSIAAEHINARLDLNGSRLRLESLTADVNGGTLKGSGQAAIGAHGLYDIDAELSTDGFAYDAPLDLRTISDGTVRIVSKGEQIVVDGEVTVEEGGLTGDINFDTGLLATVTERRKLDLREERNPLLDRVRFNVAVDTASPILVDNNLAKAEVDVNVRLLGTPYETGLSGQLEVREGGEIRLNERQYETERGIIRFLDERRIVPSFDLLLNTTANNYDVTIAINGTPDDTETTLTSEPSLPEPDIMALLVTGRTLDQMRGEEFDIAREQVLSYLAGRVGSGLGRGLEQATGLSEVRVEPHLIGNEADPSARLTVGQELTDNLELIYSTDLVDSNDQIWVAEYDVTRRFQARAVRQSDASYRADFRHDVGFGGTPPPRREPRDRPTVSRIAVAGAAALPEAELRDLLNLDEGDAFDFFKARRGVERIEQRLIDRGYLQSRVRLERDTAAGGVALTLRVVEGPLVNLDFDGVVPSSRLRKEAAELWRRGVFDRQRVDDVVEATRTWLAEANQLNPTIRPAIDDSDPARRRIVFRVEPSTRFDRVVLAFEGASQIEPKLLDKLIDDQNLERQLLEDPETVAELLQRYYREEGFLAAEVDPARTEFSGSLARIVVPIREGPRFTVGNVSVAGNPSIASDIVLTDLPAVSGEPFLPMAAENSLQKIRRLYWSRGFNEVHSDYGLTLDHDTGTVDVAFSVEEGLQSVIADIVVQGNDKTSERLVTEQLELTSNTPLDLGALSRSRKNLYDTRAFSVVDLTRQDLEGDVPADAQVTENQKPVRVNVDVREVQPLQINYGASFDTERSAGGLFDISNHNSLGKARVIGLRTRYDAQLREARGTLTQPSLRYWPLETTANIYYREERNPTTGLADGFDVDRKGLSIVQERELADKYIWSYGYRYERARTFNTGILGADETVTVSPLTTTLTREGRDEVLDASTGSFLSHAFSYSPDWLGSTLPYFKYFGQYFYYLPLQSAQRKPFTNEMLRPRLVFATGVRVGLAWGPATDIPLSERFFAGGSTTLRGFAQNSVGPLAVDGTPRGGQALLVLNNELRVPLLNRVDGVVFADIGNVYPRVSEFSLSDLRESGGVGLRVRTPWFLLRGDYGLVLDRRPNERRSRFYFSIGQAF